MVLDEAGWTRLHDAVDRRDGDEVRRRIADKANVNAAAKDGRTPLHLAAEAGDREIVRALLDGKADLNPKDAAGRTPVERAARRTARTWFRFWRNAAATCRTCSRPPASAGSKWWKPCSRKTRNRPGRRMHIAERRCTWRPGGVM